MNRESLNEIELENTIYAHFGKKIKIKKLITNNIYISNSAFLTTFFGEKNELFCYITSDKKTTLRDIKKLTVRAGIRPDFFFPPKNIANYFENYGKKKYKEIFVHAKNISARDIYYYKTLAPYNPAFFSVKEIKDGHIYQADSDARTGWRVAAKLKYKKIKTT